MSRKQRKRKHASGPRRAWTIIRVMLVVLLAIVGVANGMKLLHLGWWASDELRVAEAKLEKVVDGDTLWVVCRNERVKVRLIGIDTPELGTAASFQSAWQCAVLLESADKIWLEPDSKTPKDKYDRVLGWVWFDAGDGRLLLQEELVRAGLAELYRDAKGSDYYSRLEKAKRQSR